jgi:hypothetical protein
LGRYNIAFEVINSGREQTAAERRGKRGRYQEMGKMRGDKAVKADRVTRKIARIRAESQSERRTSDHVAAELSVAEVHGEENRAGVNVEKVDINHWTSGFNIIRYVTELSEKPPQLNETDGGNVTQEQIPEWNDERLSESILQSPENPTTSKRVNIVR